MMDVSLGNFALLRKCPNSTRFLYQLIELFAKDRSLCLSIWVWSTFWHT